MCVSALNKAVDLFIRNTCDETSIIICVVYISNRGRVNLTLEHGANVALIAQL